MVEAVIVVDPRQKILLANSALSECFDLKKQTVAGRYTWEVFRDSELNQMIEVCLARRTALKKEHTISLSHRVFEIQISPVFLSKEFLGVVAVFHDVTAVKELEKIRTEFVANVSHELKTPLTSIMGFVETLKEGAAEDPKNRERFLNIIAEHSQKLYELIEGLLLLSKIESGREELKMEALDIKPLFESIFEGVETAILKAKLKTRFELSVEPFRIWADPKIITQAFTNLVDNAIKYNKTGGEIVIEAFEEGSVSVIRVRDTGIGIPAQDLKRIFERFYRVEKSRSRESGGAGLGLSIVKHAVERHGGTIEAESAVEQGSTFTVKLPKESQ